MTFLLGPHSGAGAPGCTCKSEREPPDRRGRLWLTARTDTWRLS